MDSSLDNASKKSIEQNGNQALIETYRHFKTKRFSYINLMRKQAFLRPMFKVKYFPHWTKKEIDISKTPFKNKSLESAI